VHGAEKTKHLVCMPLGFHTSSVFEKSSGQFLGLIVMSH
jgi:hypothetical protein